MIPGVSERQGEASNPKTSREAGAERKAERQPRKAAARASMLLGEQIIDGRAPKTRRTVTLGHTTQMMATRISYYRRKPGLTESWCKPCVARKLGAEGERRSERNGPRWEVW